MLRELVDRGIIEDFAEGLARTSKLRVCVYDSRRELITASRSTSKYASLTNCLPQVLPPRLDYVRLPADEPPVQIATVHSDGAGYIVAPSYVDQVVAGFVTVGEFRLPEFTLPEHAIAQADEGTLIDAYTSLPLVDLTPDTKPIRTVRWAARMLSEWAWRELRVISMSEQLSLVGDIATLLTGENNLQTILDKIVGDTARVMKCRFCSVRLYNEKTQEFELSAGYNLSDRYLEKGSIKLDDANIIDSQALEGQMVYVEDAVRDPRTRYPEDAKQEGIVSVLTTGLIYQGRPIGIMRVYTDRKQRFRAAHRELLRAVAAQASTAIVNARLLEERLKTAEMERELELASQVQSRMMNAPLPKHPRVKIARYFKASRKVSGDFCDFLSLNDGRVAAIVADVVGKGVPAALLGASLQGALRSTAITGLQNGNLSDLVARMNEHICHETTSREFVTMLATIISADGKQLEYCSAGHEPPLLMRDGQITAIDNAGIVLGVFPNEEYHTGMIELKPGDFLLMYTDGAVDAMDFAGQRFGRDRLNESVAMFGEMPCEQAIQSIVWDIRRFIGLAEQADDLTLIGLQVPHDA